MLIRFEGIEQFTLLAEIVFAKLSDAGWVARALPDAEIIETSEDRASWRVRPKFAFMAGSLDTTAELVERIAGEKVRFRIASRGVGSSSIVEASFEIRKPEAGGTEVIWNAEVVDLGGLLKLVPRGLIQAAAQKVIADVWVSIREKISN